jgi:hypothetical protein
MPEIKTWPSSVPYVPLRDGFDMQERYKPNLSHDTEQGPGRQRAAASSIWTKLSYKISLTEDEMTVIDNFILNELAQGSARFRMPVGRFYAPEPWPFKLVYIENGVYKIEPFGAQLAISFTLKVLNW